MDDRRVDALAKGIAQRLTRRRALGGVVGAATALVAAPVLAQDATPATGGADVCLVPFEATVRSGPDAGTAYAGALALAATADGSVRGLLVPTATAAGTPVAGKPQGIRVVGQTQGRAINLLFVVGDGQELYGVGTMEHDLATCDGAMGGPFVGPQPGDAGDWGVQQIPLTGCQKSCRADFSRCSSSLSEDELNADINKCDLSLEGCLTGCDLNSR
jgi:hypothetical protein